MVLAQTSRWINPNRHCFYFIHDEQQLFQFEDFGLLISCSYPWWSKTYAKIIFWCLIIDVVELEISNKFGPFLCLNGLVLL